MLCFPLSTATQDAIQYLTGLYMSGSNKKSEVTVAVI